ncbi:MAG: hypothetical protein SH847_11670 [Roseiflexaceae bacterium]|nr:hypothetical protein [Roseiflexaceae bacterium]
MSDPKVRGTVIRGADGKLYFVPDGVLETYRVPEQAYPNLATTLASHGIDIADQQEQAERVIVDQAAAMGMVHNSLVDNAAAMGIIHNQPPGDDAAAMGIVHNAPGDDAAMGIVHNAPGDDAAMGIIHNQPTVDDAVASDDHREHVQKLTD